MHIGTARRLAHGGGGHVDDPPPSGRDHVRRHRADAVEGAGHVDLHGLAPVCVAEILHRRGRQARPAGVVDEHVAAAEGARDSLHAGVHRACVRHIRGQGQRLTARLSDLRRDRMGRSLVALRQSDPVAPAGEMQRHGTPNALPCSGNHANARAHVACPIPFNVPAPCASDPPAPQARRAPG